jgi:hypothetical protein
MYAMEPGMGIEPSLAWRHRQLSRFFAAPSPFFSFVGIQKNNGDYLIGK